MEKSVAAEFTGYGLRGEILLFAAMVVTYSAASWFELRAGYDSAHLQSHHLRLAPLPLAGALEAPPSAPSAHHDNDGSRP